MKRISTFPLLPAWCSYIGIVLLLAGILGLYFFGYLSRKPEWLDFKVFTVYSSYLESKSFTFILNNQGDEISLLLYFAGAFIFIFSAQKNEQPFHQQNRLLAFSYSFITGLLLFLVGILFLHGLAITVFSFLFPLALPLLFFVFFFTLNLKSSKWEP